MRVVLVILLISSVFTLAITVYQLYGEYQRDLGGLEQRLEQADTSFAESLGRSVWALDETQVGLQLRGILQLPHVRQVRIEGDLEMTVGESSDYPHQLRHQIPVVYQGQQGDPQTLGTVTVAADLEAIHGRLWNMGLFILVTQGVKTFSVSLLILAAFYYLVTRHLQALGRFAHGLRLDQLGEHLRLNRSEGGLLRPDELDDVSQAFDHAVTRIRSDIGAREVVEKERNLLAKALEQSPAGVVIMDHDGCVEYVNPRFVEFSGCEANDVLGEPAFQQGGWLHQRVSVAEGAGDPWEAVMAGETWQGEIRFRREDEHYRWAWISLKAVGEGESSYYIALIEDTTQLRTVQERLDFHTHFDALTELPNRVLAYEHLTRAIHRAGEGQSTALLFLDLDNFKYVNESLGHEVGDEILVVVGDRLTRYSEEDWIVARFGSDEFLVIMPNIQHPDGLAKRIEALMAALREPIPLGDETFFVAITAGVAMAPQSGQTARELLQAADTALYAAKGDRKNSLRFYESELGRESQHRLTLEGDLRHALAEGQFELHYQPVISLSSGKAVSLEALIRWRHPERGLVPPDEFIPLAEENGLIIPIGEWVLRRGLLDLASLRRHPVLQDMTVAVNVSSRQLVEGDLLATVSQALQQSHLSGEALQLELTERLFVDELRYTRQLLARLENMGISLVIDDFGTGYSALGYLRRMKVDTLKVDRDFVRDISEDEDDALLTRAIISLAHDLEIEVVAEGVETEAQLDFLRNCGCERVQGYYFARPMPLEQVERFLLEALENA
nr:EAL domain-containing protein [Natronospira proteinivora]